MPNFTLENYLNDVEKDLSKDIQPSKKSIDFLLNYSKSIDFQKSTEDRPAFPIFKN